MTLPTSYRKGGAAIASYEFIDLATGRGVIPFYCGDAASGAKLLTTYQYYATKGVTGLSGAAMTLDFDATLDRPMILDGTATINVPVILGNDGGAPETVGTTVKGSVMHYDGTTLTTLTSGAALASQSVTNGTQVNKMATVHGAVARKKFRAGEILRIRVETSAPGGNGHVSVGHDPKGRTSIDEDADDQLGLTGDWVFSTQLIANIPVVINL